MRENQKGFRIICADWGRGKMYGDAVKCIRYKLMNFCGKISQAKGVV